MKRKEIQSDASRDKHVSTVSNGNFVMSLFRFVISNRTLLDNNKAHPFEVVDAFS